MRIHIQCPNCRQTTQVYHKPSACIHCGYQLAPSERRAYVYFMDNRNMVWTGITNQIDLKGVELNDDAIREGSEGNPYEPDLLTWLTEAHSARLHG